MNNFIPKSLFALLFSALGLSAFAQEPTNYPTAFAAATQSGTSVQLTWTGSVTAPLPSNYVILIRIVPAGTFPTPVDGTPIPDDSDLTDNLGAVNVVHAVGANTYTWTGLPIDTDFEFAIYPYKTGGAPDPDFKTNATVPKITASTKRPTVTSPTVSAIGTNNATLGGTVTSNGGNALTERGTVWKSSSGVTIADNKLAEGGTSVATFTSARTGMPAGSHIFYAAYATNIAGTSLSPESSFFITSTTPDNNPASVTAVAVSGTQINLSFSSATSTGSNTSGYIILRNVGSNPSTGSVQDGIAPGALALGTSTLVTTITNLTTTSFNDTGLTPGTDYHYAVVPFNWNAVDTETYNYKTGSGFTTASDVTFSAASDIILTGGTTASINYRNSQSTSLASDGSNSKGLGTFQLRDGGASSDADGKTTTVSSITITLSNFANVRQIGLFDASNNKIAGTEQTVSGSTIVFTPSSPLVAADNGTLNFNVRATFQAVVTDNQSINVTITSATAASSGSGLIAANAGGATTSLSVTNQIAVVATKLVFAANPPTTPKLTDFSLTIKAVDGNPLNNVDLDYNNQVDLTIAGGTGTLTGGAQSLSPHLVAGLFTWTQLQISLAGNYGLGGSDNTLGDASGSILIASAGVTITKPAVFNVCFGGAYQPLGTIVITETDPTDFASSGTFSLSLPAGFTFDQTVTTAPTVGGGSDISAPSALSYPSSSSVQFSYTISGTSNTNSITITGLKVSAPDPGTSSPAPIGGSITRLGGTAIISGDSPGVVHGTVNAAQGTPPIGLGFTVVKLSPSDVDVAANETRFSQGSNAVRLVGSPGGGLGLPHVEFSGSGVTFISGEYRFNPQSLSPGTYTITYSHKQSSAQACEFTVTKQFEVYVTNITGLNAQYCNNDPASPTLSVSSAYITSRYGAGYSLQKFVYWNTPTFSPLDITAPANNIFDPKQAIYQPVYSSTASVYGIIGIWIGFNITNGVNTFTEWQLIPVKPAPTVTFTIPKTSFCADDLPVTLTGNPVNSDVIGEDFFTVPPAQSASVTSSPAPVVWSFNPASVPGVSLGVPATFNMTYTYRDPATGCSGTSTAKTITVNARPSSVVAGSITSSGGVSQQICPGASVSDFTAVSVPSGPLKTTYSWYDATLINPKQGDSFTPTVNNTVAATTNFFVTRTIAGCESNIPPGGTNPVSALQLSVVVNASPAQPVPDFNRAYCIGQSIPASDFQILGGTQIKWYTGPVTGTPTLNNVSSPTLAQITGAGPNSLAIDNSVASSYSFNVTQTTGSGCEGTINPTKINVTIKPLPALSVTADADLLTICKTDPIIIFTAKDGINPASSITGNISWSGVSAIVPNPPAGTAQLDPSTSSLAPGNYALTFNYTNNTTSCSSSVLTNLTVFPTITPSISIGTACDKSPVNISNLSSIVPTGSPTTIASTSWSFGDGSTVTAGSGPIVAPDDNGGKTTGTYFSPSHTFAAAANYQLSYVMTTSDGCVVAPPAQLITIYPKPNVNFTWANACLSTTSTTQFNASTNPALAIATYNWMFHVNGNLNYSAAGTGANPIVNYSNTGKDSVNLIVTTIHQCKDTIQKAIFIVPSYPAINDATSYTQNFDSGAGGWVQGGKNSSWALGTPAKTVINKASSGANAWVTNLTGNNNAKESSWVLSGCFDFTQALKPVISVDIWSNTPEGVDGTVLQYNLNGDIEDDASWTVLGAVSTGVNWYDQNGVISNPGNQSSVATGWTGSLVGGRYTGWKTAIFKLDELIGKNNVIFRIAFASASGGREGFAFDNVFVGERTRVVLLENFTNSSTAAAATSHNAYFKSFGNAAELVKIQYHTPFPGDDPINDLNKEMNNSRAAFYGITSAPTARMDGDYGAGNLATWLNAAYNDRVLTPSPLKLTITAVKDGKVVRINTSVKNVSSQTVPIGGSHVFTTIVQKSVTSPALLGNSGNTEFVFVARQMLPTAAGIVIPADLAAGQTYNVPEVVWNDPTGDAIVVSVQSIDGSNKSVFQSKLSDTPPLPDLVTGFEPTLAEQISLYPNPADQSLTIVLPSAVREDTPLKMYDVNGHEVYNAVFEKGHQNKTLGTQDLSGGVYLLQINTGNVIRKKVMVLHRQ